MRQALSTFVDQYFHVVKEESRERGYAKAGDDGDGDGTGTGTDGEGRREYKVMWCATLKVFMYVS